MSGSLRNILLALIGVISFFMHYPHLSKDLISVHVWRQTQTQSTIVNFYEEDMNILNPRRNDRGNTEGTFRMEFPLMQWIVAWAYKVFGNHLIISRLAMFLIGLYSILGLFHLLKTLFNNEFIAVIGAWAFNFSPAFFYYTINPLPDNMALCCGIWGIVFFFHWLNHKQIIHLILSGLLISIGTLCKLPFVVYFAIPVVYFIQTLWKQGWTTSTMYKIIAGFSFAILPASWYISVIPSWQGNMIVQGMLNNNDTSSRILDYLQHNLISTLPELLLNYGSLLFFLAGFYFLVKRQSYKDPRFIMILGLCTGVLFYFFYEINAIAKVHDYYLFPFYPLLFILVAYGAYHLFNSKNVFLKGLTLMLLFILPFTCYIRMKPRWNKDSPGFNKDLLTYKEELQAAVPKDALVIAGNDNSHFIFFYYIDKKGWGFHNDEINSTSMKRMIAQGAEYLYTDSGDLIQKNELQDYLDELILEKGTIKVFSLKK